MKIAIAGYSGSGKSTLAKRLGDKYAAPVLHFDTVQYLPGWEVRELDEQLRLTRDFLNNNSSWVIDGNYFKLCYEQRMSQADIVILMLFNRFTCLWRALRRYFVYRGTTRPDMAEGCNEKFDFEFFMWILRDGRTKERRAKYEKVIKQYGHKTVVIKNQRKLEKFLSTL